MAKAIQWTNIEKNKKELDWVGLPCQMLQGLPQDASLLLAVQSISCWMNNRHPSHHQEQEQGCHPPPLQKTRQTRWHLLPVQLAEGGKPLSPSHSHRFSLHEIWEGVRSIVSSPTRWSLYWPLALCIDRPVSASYQQRDGVHSNVLSDRGPVWR